MSIPIETVRTPRFTMDFFRFGQGKRPLVVLPGLSVQSVMGLADTVARVYRSLSEDYRVCLFDRRRDIPESYTIHDMARDTAEAIEALGLSGVDLFGASQGGMIAMTIAIEHPELVHRLILGSTAARVDEARYQVIGHWVDLARRGDRTGLYLAFGEAVYPREVFEPSRQLLIDTAKTVTDGELARFVILAEGAKGFDVSDGLKKIACPTLVLGARDDHVLGAEASVEIARQLQGREDCQLHMYEGYGHAAYDLAPDYRERMARFLAD